MRNLSFILAFLLISISVQAQNNARFTQQAKEIDIVKAWFQAYNAGEWDKLQTFYTTDAVIQHNDSGKTAPAQVIPRLKNTASLFSTYGITLSGEEERIINDQGETWVNAWGKWDGKVAATGEDVHIELYSTFRFEDGKIVEEYHYYDQSPMQAARRNINKQVVQTMYDAFAEGDIPTVLAQMDEKIVWNEAKGNKYAAPTYIGPNAVREGVFARIRAEYEYFKLKDIQLHGMADNKVLATLRYDAKWKTGSTYDAQVAHFWTLKDGKVVAFQRYVDTKQSEE